MPGPQLPSAHWQIQSSAKAQQSGAEVSSAGLSNPRLVPGERPRDGDGGAVGEWHVQERVLQRQPACGRGARFQRQRVRDSLVVSHRVHLSRRRARNTHAAAYQRHDRERRCLVEWEPGRRTGRRRRRLSRARARRDTLGARGHQHPRIARASGRSEDELGRWLGRLEPDATGQQHGPVAGRGHRAQGAGRDTVLRR